MWSSASSSGKSLLLHVFTKSPVRALLQCPSKHFYHFYQQLVTLNLTRNSTAQNSTNFPEIPSTLFKSRHLCLLSSFVLGDKTTSTPVTAAVNCFHRSLGSYYHFKNKNRGWPSYNGIDNKGKVLLKKMSAGVCSCSPGSCQCRNFFTMVERGSPYTPDYRVYIQDKNGPISPLHDIPLVVDAAKKTFNMVVEVPRWTNAKMEINMKEILNPIRQDIKKGKPRFVANVFPHHGYIWNYGALPQTWENPEHLDDGTGCKGDNDPIDVIEIGYRVAKRGEILQVKILGTIALIDEGETDWKLIAIDVKDPLADQLNDVPDIEKHFPGLLKASVEWFKLYKVPDGKPENQFAFNGEAKSAAFALKIVDEVHKFWKGLVNKEVDPKGISCTNTTLEDNSFKITTQEALDVINKTPPLAPSQDLDPIVDKWHFVHLK